MKIEDRLKNEISNKYPSIKTFAKEIDLPYTTLVTMLNNGINRSSVDNVIKVCKALDLNLETLVQSNDNEVETQISADSPTQYPFIPDAVAAGIPCTIEGRKDLPTIGISDAIMGKYAGNRHIIIMRVNGESMNKVIPNGSFVAVKTDVNVENLHDGDLVVFGKAHEYSLKHFYDGGNEIIFKPNSTDPTFRDHVFSKDETIKIVGKIVLYMVGLV